MTPRPEDMTSRERKLLLYFEACAVEHGGLVAESRLSVEDLDLATLWAEAGYIAFGRVRTRDLRFGADPSNHVVTLGAAALQDAQAFRRARMERRTAARTRLTEAEARARGEAAS